MPLDQELLDILVCPETREPLAEADADVLDRLNAAIEDGGVRTRDGKAVMSPVVEGLLRKDGRVLYPVREGIPIMLIDEAIEISEVLADSLRGRTG